MERNAHLDKLFDQFLQSLLNNWTPDLVFLQSDPVSHEHVFIVDRPFFIKYSETFQHFDSGNVNDLAMLVESFLDILPEPKMVHGQERPPYEESLLGQIHSGISAKFPRAQSLHSLTPFFDYIVSRMLTIVLSALDGTKKFNKSTDENNNNNNNNNDDQKFSENPNSPSNFSIPLPQGTIDWIIQIFELNLQRIASQQSNDPLTNAYASRSMLEWCKIIGLLSLEHSDRIRSMFKIYLDQTKNMESMSEVAVFYFTALRYIRVVPHTQLKWLQFFSPYLSHRHKKSKHEVLSSMLLTLVNVFRQMHFERAQDSNEVLLLGEMNEQLKKMADKKKAVKRHCYLSNLCFLLRSPQGLYKLLNPFLEKRILAHIPEPDKCENSLDMLLYMFSGTHDPWPYHIRRPINWRSKIRAEEEHGVVRDRMKLVFKHFTRSKSIKVLRQHFWRKSVRVVTHLFAQDIEFAFTHLLPQCFDQRKASPEMMILGLDVMSEMLRVDSASTFHEQIRLSQENIQMCNNQYLPDIFNICEKNIGLSKLQERENPALIYYNEKLIKQLDVFEAYTEFVSFDELLAIAFEDDKTISYSESSNSSKNPANLSDSERIVLSDAQYSQYKDAELLKFVVTHKDLFARTLIQVRQKHRNPAEFEEATKKPKKKAKTEYLDVLKSCVRCVLGMRPSDCLTDPRVQNLTYIGRFLLHPDLETVITSYSVLHEIIKQEKMLLSPIVNALTNYLLQWYIHKSSCISILLQTLAMLVTTFIESHSRIEILRDRTIVEDLCISFHRLDALSFAFFCHTNLYVRFACIQLTIAIEAAMKILIAYYYSDKTTEEQQQQMAFPSSLGQLFSRYSDEIMARAIRKHGLHQDNIKLTVVAYEKYFLEEYQKSMDADFILPPLLHSLLVPFEYAPFSSLMDAIVEKIESLCLDGSLYFKFLRVDCCQEYLLQPNWLAVDKESDSKQVLGSMCISLIPVIGFSDNGMDDDEFYESIWKQVERFNFEGLNTLVNTILYSVQCAHSTRMIYLFNSLVSYFQTNFKSVEPNVKMKKKSRKAMKRRNSLLVWMYNYVILALTGKDRLYEAFLSEVLEISSNNNNNAMIDEESEQSSIYLHARLIHFCNELDDNKLMKFTSGDPETLRCVSRIVENVSSSLYKVYLHTKQDWVLRLWKAQDRCQLLETLKIWSQCNSDPRGRKIVNKILLGRKKIKDKEKDRVREKELRTRIMQLEYQAFRACTGLLSLGPALNSESIMEVQEMGAEDDEKESAYYPYFKSQKLPTSWFAWAIQGQKEGIPSLKYLMQNHYHLMLGNILACLYADLSRGDFAAVKIFFDVVALLELPDAENQNFDSQDITNKLVVFCLIHLVPFIPAHLIINAQQFAYHRRDVASLITFRGIPVDNYGSNYSVSLPAAMKPSEIWQSIQQSQSGQPGTKYIHRPRLLSFGMVHSPSMGRGEPIGKSEGIATVQLVDDVMQTIDMSRKAFALFYKVVLTFINSKVSLDKLHELRMGLQSNDLKDVRQNASQTSWVFANACPTEDAIAITSEIMDTLAVYAERIETLEDRLEFLSLNPHNLQDQITIISNFLQTSLPWFAKAPLHQRVDEDRDSFMEQLLNLTLRFHKYKKPEIDNAFYRIWHVVVTSNDTMMSNPIPNNIDICIQFLIRTVIGRYEGHRSEMFKIERMLDDARRAAIKKQQDLQNTKGKKKKRNKKRKGSFSADEYTGPTVDEIEEIRRSSLKPEQFIALCENIVRQIFASHSESVLSALLQLVSVGCGLGGHVSENSDHIQVKRPGHEHYIDTSYELGGEEYALLVTEIVMRWFTSLATRSFNKLRTVLPVLLVHCSLFLWRTVEVLSNPSAEFLSHLFVSLLPPKLGIDDEVIQIAIWMRDRRTYHFEWSDELINDIEPEKTNKIYQELALAFDESKHNNRFDLRRFFAKHTAIHIDDIVRILYCCFRHRYGDREAIVWGVRTLQWATINVDPDEQETVFRARMFASKALRLFSIISQPKTLRSVTMILKAILIGLHASEVRWNKAEDESLKYSKEDIHLSLAIRGIEALVSIIRTQDWNRTLFRMVLVSFWVALSLLHCRIARIQIAARRLLRVVLEHRKWLVYLFGHAKDADGNNIRQESVSLNMFWSFYHLFSADFSGIQERVISSLIFTIGEDSPVSLNTDIMMILCDVWLIRCDVLHDANISSRLSANLAFFLPYACAILDASFFEPKNVERHLSAHRRTPNKRNPALGDNENDYLAMNDFQSLTVDDDETENDNDNDNDDLDGEELRKRVDRAYRLRKENARIFKTLALYLKQNIVEENKNGPVIKNLESLSPQQLNEIPMPAWSKIQKEFRQTYVGIYDVVQHIATTLMSSLTWSEPSTRIALTDLCQHLIDIFIPTQAATLANTFSICLLIGDRYLKTGTLRALQLFVPLLFKQSQEMNVFEEVIGCFDDTFEHCTRMTSDPNERVAKVAHELVFDLTTKGYQSSTVRSRLMRNMYPAFKLFDPNNDGMATTISCLEKILNKSLELLVQFPDEPKMDPRLIRLLKMKPMDRYVDPMKGAAPRRMSAMPQAFQADNNNNINNVPLRQRPGSLGLQNIVQPPRPSNNSMPVSAIPSPASVSSVGNNHSNRSNSNSNSNSNNDSQQNLHQQRGSSFGGGSEVGVSAVIRQAAVSPEPQRANQSQDNNNHQSQHRQQSTLMVHGSMASGYGHRTVPTGVSDVSAPDLVMQGSERDLRVGIQRTETELIGHNVQQRLLYNEEHKNDDTANAPSYKNNPNKLPFGMKDTRSRGMVRSANSVRNASGSVHQRVGTFGQSQLNLERYADAEEADAESDDDDSQAPNVPRMASFNNDYLRKSQQEVYGGHEPSGVMSGSDDEAHAPPMEMEDAPPAYAMAANPGSVNIPPMSENEEYTPGNAMSDMPPGSHVDMDNVPPGSEMSGGPGAASAAAAAPASAVVMDIPPMDDNNNNNNNNNNNENVNNMNNMSNRQQAPLNMDEVPVIVKPEIPVGDLSTFLDDKSLLRTFLKFLKKKTQDYKLLEFYLMAGQFKEYAEDPKSTNIAQRNNAKLIIETFFLPDSKKFLETIQGITRHEAMSKFLNAAKETELESTIFERSRQEIKAELISRVFPIFMQSDRYRKLVDAGKIRPP